MIKLAWLIFGAVVLVVHAFGAEGIGRSPEGLVQVENIKFGIAFWSMDWKTCVTQRTVPDAVSFHGEGGVETPQGIRRDGMFRISDRMGFRLTETAKQISGNELLLSLDLKSDTAVPFAIIAWQTVIPNDAYAVNPAVFNGTVIPPDRKKQQEFDSRNKDELVLNLKNGSLKITGSFRLTVRTHSWGTEVRVLFARTWGKIRDTGLKIHLLYTPYASTELNLRSVMNMGFRDEVAGDRCGGWTDQGADNDLRAMLPGCREFAGIPFDIVDPAKNGGKSCLAMKGGARPYFAANAGISVPEISGLYLYLLNGLAWAPEKGTPCGKVTVSYTDGSHTGFMLKCGMETGNFWGAYDLPEAPVVWASSNRSSSVGLYATRLTLDPAKKVSRVEFHSQNQVWMILAATISNRVPEKRKATAVVMRADKDWMPFASEFRTVRGSVADLSFLLDAPAGKYGFLKTDGDHFVFEKRPGVPVRFWGANVCMEAIFMEKDGIRTMLDDFSAMGYNTLRLHHFDYILTRNEEKTGVFDPEKLDRLDFLVAEAKKRGIYITFDLLTVAQLESMAKVGLSWKTGDYKTLCYFDPVVREAFLAFAKKLFGHVNPYTGLAWKDDPVFITLNLINEGTLPVSVKRAGTRTRSVVDAAFRHWLEQKGLSASEESAERWTEFLEETGKEFFSWMKHALTEFGVRIPLSDQNFADAAGNTRAAFDYVDTHLYWGHPLFIGKHTWKLPSYTNPASAIASNAGGIGDVFHVRVFGRPMTVTEWGYCYPNPHNFEGPFLVAAYSALQDFGGLWQFCYSHAAGVDVPKPLGSFDFHAHPVMKLAVRAGSLLFLRGDVKSALSSISGSPDGLRAAGRTVALITKVGRRLPGKTLSGALVLHPDEAVTDSGSVFRVKNSRDAVRKLEERNVIPSGCADFRSTTVKSDTGELTLNPDQGTFRVVAPNSEALLLKGGQGLDGDVLNVRNGSVFAAFFISSLDGLPLKESGRIVLMHLTDVKSEGAVFRDASMSVLEDSGSAARLLRRNKASVTLNLAGTYRLFACAPNGKRLFEVPLKRNGETLSFPADNSKSGGVVLYELTRENK